MEEDHKRISSKKPTEMFFMHKSGASNQLAVWGHTSQGHDASISQLLSFFSATALTVIWRSKLRTASRVYWHSPKNQCLWCNFQKKCISAVLQRDSDITLRVRLLTGFPSAWLPNVTGAPRIPISSSPQLQILENNPLPTPTASGAAKTFFRQNRTELN